MRYIRFLPNLDSGMISLANYRPFLRSFRYIPPSGDLCHVSSLVCETRQHRLSSAKCLFAQKLGPNLSEMEVRTFLRIKKVIWDQLLAFQTEIIEGKLYFSFACANPTRHVFE